MLTLFRPEFGLYNIINDPDEIQNLAGDKAYSKILDSLKQKIKVFQEQTSDPWIIMWNHDSTMQGTGVGL